MPISKNYIMKRIGDEYMIIPLSGSSYNMTKTFNINQTAAFIYMKLENDKTVDEIAHDLTLEYEVSVEEAKNDVLEFVEILKTKGIYYEK